MKTTRLVFELIADATPDKDNLYPQSGSHHTSQGRYKRDQTEEFYNPNQPRAKDGKWRLSGSGSFAPSPRAASIRQKYMSKIGKTPDPAFDEALQDVRAPAGFRARLARAYAKAPENQPEAHAAYKKLLGEVREQYQHMLDSGMKVEVVDYDPYPSINEMVRDINANSTLKVMSTATTGGHAMFDNDGNDMFRAVHDFYGHAATGRDFSRHGERATYLAHAATMKDQDSVRALFTETEAQNAYLIANGSFAPTQKIVLFPDKQVYYGLVS